MLYSILGLVIFFGWLIAKILKKNTYYSGQVSDHFDGKRFFDPKNPKSHAFIDVLKWRFLNRPKKPNWDLLRKSPISKNVYNSSANNFTSELSITHIGHCTFLIRVNGINILTDPVWSERASPVSFGGPKRISHPGMNFDDLPKIDIVLISHNHYDHLDIKTIKNLWHKDKPTIITPLGNDSIIRRHNKNIQVHTLDWHQNYQFSKEIDIHLAPVQHWSARGLFDANHALWGGFSINTPTGNIFFIGDSGYKGTSYFTEYREKFGPPQVAIIPIGAFKPKWFMGYSHMDPTEAVSVWEELGNPIMIPSHYDVFELADEDHGEALSILKNHIASLEENIQSKALEKIKILEIGETLEIESNQEDVAS
jgi:L-ascorbate metabolism protein UlaG (beta-lactamase superfamily)